MKLQEHLEHEAYVITGSEEIHIGYLIKQRNSNKDKMYYWYCDGCGSYLNIQEGFENNKGIWECAHCGYKNQI